MMEMLAEEMTGLSLLDRPNFKRLATNRRPEARDTEIKLPRKILEDSLAERIADELSFCWRMHPLGPKSRGFLHADRVYPVQNLRRRSAYRCCANVAPNHLLGI
jgi:hypothetical protein